MLRLNCQVEFIGYQINPTNEVLSQLKPSNDVCEVLGLNDYLTTALPNLDQVSRSNLVQMKNKTVEWLDTLPQQQQNSIVNFAVKRRSV